MGIVESNDPNLRNLVEKRATSFHSQRLTSREYPDCDNKNPEGCNQVFFGLIKCYLLLLASKVVK